MSRIIGRQTHVIRCFPERLGGSLRSGNGHGNQGPAGLPIQFFPGVPPGAVDVGKGEVEGALGEFGTVDVIFV